MTVEKKLSETIRKRKPASERRRFVLAPRKSQEWRAMLNALDDDECPEHRERRSEGCVERRL